jgi:hypothetical protein
MHPADDHCATGSDDKLLRQVATSTGDVDGNVTDACFFPQEIDVAREEAIDQAIAAKDAAESELAEERGIRERMMQLAAQGQLPGQAADGVAAAATPGS